MTRAQRIQDFREQMRARLAQRGERIAPLASPPRHDEVFYAGVAWLDRLSYLDRWE